MADGKVTISTALDNTGLIKGIQGIKGLLGGLKNVLAGLVTSMAAGVAAITKQAVDAYADYEQLTGGVVTLFGDSAKKVVAYAENAFFAAGLSANEYMEQVIGISASLISSLGGDTEKAADIANMALSDMADNANKMGNPLERVQVAYAGFAKQQYTLLDNLALGYQGTKTEMERLLKDAEAYSGVKYDINNLADVYSAIHAIQEKLGIAGATAEEAEGTISGSAAMTAAAWKNVLSAISGGGDLDKAINNLVYSVSKYFGNIVPVVERSLGGIGQLIEQVAPQLVQTVAVSLIKAIPSLLNAVYQMIIGLAKGIYQGIIALFSGGSVSGEITKQLNNVSAGFVASAGGAEDLADATEKAGKAAKKSLAGFDELNVLADQSSGASAGEETAVSSTGGVSAGDISFGANVKDQISPAFQAILDKIETLIEPLKEIDLTPLSDSLQELKDAVDPLARDAWDGLEWAYDEILVPLADWTIEDALPAFLGVLTSALRVLGSVIAFLKPYAQWLWDNFLQPAAEWTGDAIVTGLNSVSQALDDAAVWIDENRDVIADYAVDAWAKIEETWTNASSWFDENVTQPVAGLFADMGLSISDSGTEAKDGITEEFSGIATWFDEKVTQPVAGFFSDLGTDISNFATDAKDGITDAFSGIATWFDENVIQPVAGFFSDLWLGAKEGAEDAWQGAEEAFGAAGTFFRDTFEDAWADVVSVFSVAGEIFVDIKDGILTAFKEIVNGIISGLNKAIEVPFSGINTALRKIRDINIAGVTPFKDLIKTISVPEIPYLAQGAVLPPNKPFMAVVGDQRHGTNIEAPLETIQEAVALVMQDYAASNLAGHEATVAVLREILEAVLGITIGDDVIANAVSRYQTRMAVVRGERA